MWHDIYQLSVLARGFWCMQVILFLGAIDWQIALLEHHVSQLDEHMEQRARMGMCTLVSVPVISRYVVAKSYSHKR